MDGWPGGWVDGWVGGWMGGWLAGWMNGWMHHFPLSLSLSVWESAALSKRLVLIRDQTFLTKYPGPANTAALFYLKVEMRTSKGMSIYV